MSWACMCYGTYMEIRGQLLRVSLSLHGEIQGPKPGHQAGTVNACTL